MLMEIFMKGIGTMIKLTGRGHIFMQMEPTYNGAWMEDKQQGMELKLGQMVQSMKDNI